MVARSIQSRYVNHVSVAVLNDLPAGEVARSFGVYSTASGRSERALFVLDASGVVVWSGSFPHAVNPGVDAVLSALEAIAQVEPGWRIQSADVSLERQP